VTVVDIDANEEAMKDKHEALLAKQPVLPDCKSFSFIS
jgi:hypothetical protein